MWSIEDATALLYLSRKSNNFSEIETKFSEALKDWQLSFDSGAKDTLLCWIQATSQVSDPLLTILAEQLTRGENIDANLQLLNFCSRPASVPNGALHTLWTILGTTEDSEIAESVSHAIVMLLPTFSDLYKVDFSKWWPHIVKCLLRTEDKKHATAGLRAWLACMITPDAEEIRRVVYADTDVYFKLLQSAVSKASKYGLQILSKTLDLADSPIECESMHWDSRVPGARNAWARYSSLCDILGVDTSMHQAEDTLADFVVLLSEDSPIPPPWCISLINVGICASNSDGIKSLITNLILHLKPEQMHSLVSFPEYVAHTLYARILQTPNFVVLKQQCLHAENMEAFTRNLIIACLNRSVDAARDFVYELGQYFMHRPHSYEAPRVLIIQALLDTLPNGSLTMREVSPLQNAARAASLTYTSKAMADLFVDLCAKLAYKSGPETKPEEINWHDVAISEATTDGALSRTTFEHLKDKKVPETLLKAVQAQPSPSKLMDALLLLQLTVLTHKKLVSQNQVQELLESQLNSPRSANSDNRARLNETIGLAFDYIEKTSADFCNITFMKFDALYPRVAALRCFKRGITTKISVEFLEDLWNQVKEASLRIQDRDLHHEYIELLTNPDLVACLSVDICYDIIEQSAQRKNLLVPLARGVLRFSNCTNSGNSEAANLVMAKLFCYIRSEEHTVQLEELIAMRYGVSEQNWGEPETFSRVIAARFLTSHLEHSEAVAKYILDKAELTRVIGGSFDNVEARQRALYYQALILQQKAWSQDFATKVMHIVKTSLTEEASPLARVHAEWLLALIIADHANYQCPDFVLGNLSGLEGSVTTPPRLVGSLIRVALLLYFSEGNDKALALGEALIERLLPLATSNKAAVRHRAISALYVLSQSGKVPQHLKYLVDSIALISEAGVKNSSYQNDAYLWSLDDTRLGPVCGGVSSSVFDHTMGDTLMESDFTVLEGFDHGPCWNGEPVKLRKNDIPRSLARDGLIRDAVEQASTDFSSHVQTKSAASDLEARAQRTSLVVVATLCDKPVNLGAITRLSDALGVSLLTMRDTSITSDTQFKSTALTAEKWIPIQQVTETDLAEFLRSKKAEGFTLVGIEQTDTSVKLGPKLQFPEKTVLMMGHEKQGIPADLLALLDTCIEIEQLGYVRSMNIQTATAVVVHAYNHQHGPHIQRVAYLPEGN